MKNRLEVLRDLLVDRLEKCQAGLDAAVGDVALRHKLTEIQVTLGQVEGLLEKRHGELSEAIDGAKASILQDYFNFLGVQAPDPRREHEVLATEAVALTKLYVDRRPHMAAMLIVALVDEYCANSVDPMLDLAGEIGS